MKLIIEGIDDFQPLIEQTETGEKNYFIEGVFLQSNITNRNKRLYPKSVMSEEVARYTQEAILANRAVGELGHPSGPQINQDRISHMIKELREDGDNYIGRAKIITSVPCGKIVAGLMDEGYKMGVSSRGMGSLKKNSQGIMEVQNDFRLATAADIVHDPSAPSAFVNGIMEGVEFWMTGDNMWESRPVEQLREHMQSMKAKEIQEQRMTLFETFLSSLVASKASKL